MVHVVMNAPTYQNIAESAKRYTPQLIQTLSHLLLIGFALSGVAVMILSLISWLIMRDSWMAGFALVTGGILLSSATTLIIGKLSKCGDNLQRKFPKKLSSEPA